MRSGGQLGPNVGFGYLGDDDDDSSSGGAAPDTFDAMTSVSIAETSVNSGVTVYVDVAASSAQTNASVWVTIANINQGFQKGTSSTPFTIDNAGWSESGWTYDSGADSWVNHFTKASFSGAAQFQIVVTSTTAGYLAAATTTGYNAAAHLPATDQASGAGDVDLILFDAPAYTLEMDASATPDPIANLGTLSGSVTVIVGGDTQTTLTCSIAFKYDDGSTATLNGSPSTIDDDGWTVTWNNIGDGQYTGTITRASQGVGSTAPKFTLLPYKNGHSQIYIRLSSASSTQVASPTTNDSFSNFS